MRTVTTLYQSESLQEMELYSDCSTELSHFKHLKILKLSAKVKESRKVWAPKDLPGSVVATGTAGAAGKEQERAGQNSSFCLPFPLCLLLMPPIGQTQLKSIQQEDPDHTTHWGRVLGAQSGVEEDGK